MAESRRWVVTASGDRPLNDVKKKLVETGFDVDQVLGEIGIITGAAGDEIVEKLRAVPGVADVSPEPSVDIGLPDAPETW